MSLDVYLKGPAEQIPCECSRCWTEHMREYREEFFQANITHNLNTMATAAGVYEACWRPEEIGITKAAQLIEPLKAGIKKLKADPGHFSQFNPSNGWGDYRGLVIWLEEYLEACIEHPEADVSVSR